MIKANSRKSTYNTNNGYVTNYQYYNLEYLYMNNNTI